MASCAWAQTATTFLLQKGTGGDPGVELPLNVQVACTRYVTFSWVEDVDNPGSYKPVPSGVLTGAEAAAAYGSVAVATGPAGGATDTLRLVSDGGALWGGEAEFVATRKTDLDGQWWTEIQAGGSPWQSGGVLNGAEVLGPLTRPQYGTYRQTDGKIAFYGSPDQLWSPATGGGYTTSGIGGDGMEIATFELMEGIEGGIGEGGECCETLDKIFDVLNGSPDEAGESSWIRDWFIADPNNGDVPELRRHFEALETSLATLLGEIQAEADEPPTDAVAESVHIPEYEGDVGGVLDGFLDEHGVDALGEAPEGGGGPPVWTFQPPTVPFASIGQLPAVTVDWQWYEMFRLPIHGLILSGMTVWGLGRVFAEFRRQ